MANLSTIKNKKEELTAAQKKKLKAQLEKKGLNKKQIAQGLKKIGGGVAVGKNFKFPKDIKKVNEDPFYLTVKKAMMGDI